jgi:hypothetical protein
VRGIDPERPRIDRLGLPRRRAARPVRARGTREPEKARDHARERVELARDRSEALAAPLAGRQVLAQHLGARLDRGERALHAVRYGRREAAERRDPLGVRKVPLERDRLLERRPWTGMVEKLDFVSLVAARSSRTLAEAA